MTLHVTLNYDEVGMFNCCMLRNVLLLISTTVPTIFIYTGVRVTSLAIRALVRPT